MSATTGNDILNGGPGDDVIEALAGDDQVSGGGGQDLLRGQAGDDTLSGDAGRDTVEGGEDDDLLLIQGDITRDRLDGGAGNDTLANLGGVVMVSTGSVFAGIELLDMAGWGISGTAGDDWMVFVGLGAIANAAFVDGGAGNDSMAGTASDDSLGGGSENDWLIGEAGDDTLDGGAGADTLRGGEGNDLLLAAGDITLDDIAGGAGNDTLANLGGQLVVSTGTRLQQIEVLDAVGWGIFGTAGDDLMDFSGVGRLANTPFVTGADGNDTLIGTADPGGEVMGGGQGDDSVAGGGGDDTLDGGEGADTVAGGSGADRIEISGDITGDVMLGGAGLDTAWHTGGGLVMSTGTVFDGIELLDMNAWGILGTGGADAIDLSGLGRIVDLGFLDALGGDDTIIGTDFATGEGVLQGGEGNDSIAGGGGNDTLAGGDGADTVDGGAGHDELLVAGNIVGDYMIGGDGFDTVRHTGGGLVVGTGTVFEFVEVLDMAGWVIDGTPGDDYVIFYDLIRIANQAGIRAGDGNDTIYGTGAPAGEAIFGGTGDDELGSAGGNDTLDGEDGADTLYGSAGDNLMYIGGIATQDQFWGYGGNDTVLHAGGGGVVMGTGTLFDGIALLDMGGWQIDGTAGADVLNLAPLGRISNVGSISGGDGADTIYGTRQVDGLALNGGNGNDLLVGLGGDDTLSGDLDDDTVSGGGGDDLLLLGGIATGDVLMGGGGNDTVLHSGGGLVMGTGTLFASIELLDMAGWQIEGTNGADLLNFANLGRIDDVASINGGHGADTIYGTNQADGLALGGGTGNDLVVGRDGNDTLSGDLDDDTVSGGAGDDVLLLAGVATGDLLIGGAGNDTVLHSGGGLVIGAMTRFREVERLDMAGWGIDATSTDDVLDFSVFGSVVNAAYVSGGGGNDTMFAAGNGHALSGAFGEDRLVGNAGADLLFGDAGLDTLVGNGGNDTLHGGTENDVLAGGLGADSLVGGEGFDIATYAGARGGVAASLATGGTAGEAAGDSFLDVEGLVGSDRADTLTGDAGNNRLVGGDGDDLLTGGDGLDVLVGGLGGDTMVGGEGADRFRYTAMADSEGRHDRILGFRFYTDIIDLSAIDADGDPTNGDQAFTYIGTAAFTAPGQLQVEQLGPASWRVHGKDGREDLIILLDDLALPSLAPLAFADAFVL